MKLLDSLRSEHEIIERVVRSLVTFARDRGDDPARAADGERYVRFFRLYAGQFHHGREEGVLFPALARETDVPVTHGPIAALVSDHAAMGAVFDELASVIVSFRDADYAEMLATEYATALLHHVDAENSVLFGECEARFRRVSVLELDDRAPDDDERAALRDAGRLVERHPPAAMTHLVRGEGCVCCPRFGADCDGVEREWSSELEWDDMIDRVG